MTEPSSPKSASEIIFYQGEDGLRAEGELDPGPTNRKFRIVQVEGRKEVSRIGGFGHFFEQNRENTNEGDAA
jgi:hypothetical protein